MLNTRSHLNCIILGVWGGVFCINAFTIILDIGCGLTLNRGRDHWPVSMIVLVSIHGMQPAGAMSASPALGTGDDCRIHMFFQKRLLPCVHPQTSGIAHCLPSKPVVGDLAESQVHMGASFLPSWSCQCHILLSAAECLKILLTALRDCGPEPQHSIVVLSKPFESWIKKEQSEICSLSPAAHIEGFYSRSPMGHCKPWLSQEAKDILHRRECNSSIQTHLDTCRNKADEKKYVGHS